MKNLTNNISFVLNNEIGGANLQTLIITGAGIGTLAVAIVFKQRFYEWIKLMSKKESDIIRY